MPSTTRLTRWVVTFDVSVCGLHFARCDLFNDTEWGIRSLGRPGKIVMWTRLELQAEHSLHEIKALLVSIKPSRLDKL